jgi:hypothetical protein
MPVEWWFVFITSIVGGGIAGLLATQTQFPPKSRYSRWVMRQPILVRAVLSGVAGGVGLMLLELWRLDTVTWNGAIWAVGWMVGMLVVQSLSTRST